VGSGTAVVTGSASGVGAATVERLSRRGFDVIGVDLHESAGTAQSVEGSVAEPSTWLQVHEAASALPAPPTVIVFSAAVLHTGSVLELEPAKWQQTFDVNVGGVFHGLRALLPDMIAAGGGSIVTVASVDAFMAEQGLASYCASKGALLQLTRCVAMDHARDGIRANCVTPGVIDTPFFRRHLETSSDPDQFLHVREQRNPLGRLLQPDEVAATVEFAALDASGMTGASLTVDAGLSASFDFRTGAEGA
jgi:NAD(P)-dependent dehydrogenase (short-subunit alcohol dehydrogenase family)